MTTNNVPSKLPAKIVGYWLEDDEFLSEFGLLENWTPFEAACLIWNCKPGEITGGTAKVGRVPNPDFEEDYNQDANDGLNTEDLINLTNIIVRNFPDKALIPAIEIVKWAVRKELLRPKSYLARRLLAEEIVTFHSTSLDLFDDCEPAVLLAKNIIRRYELAEAKIESLEAEIDRLRKNSKKTGDNHAINRIKILGATILEISKHVESADFMKDGKLIFSRIANQVDDMRHIYKFNDKHGSTPATITKTISDAVKQAKNSE